MTAQEIFDTVVAHLRKQNEVSVDDVGVCKYRSDDGLKCAVGCLIDDDHYEPSMEGKTVEILIELGLLPEHLKPHKNLLIELQTIHDHDDPGNWESEFERVAECLNLYFDSL
jgi:hypothetical protein